MPKPLYSPCKLTVGLSYKHRLIILLTAGHQTYRTFEMNINDDGVSTAFARFNLILATDGNSRWFRV